MSLRVAIALLVSAACAARQRGPDIRIEMEAASVDEEAADGGEQGDNPHAAHGGRLRPESEKVQGAFGDALRSIEEPMRDCGRDRDHPAEGRAKVLVHVSPQGSVIAITDEVSAGMEPISQCIQAAVRGVHFPKSDRRHALKLESRFEIER